MALLTPSLIRRITSAEAVFRGLDEPAIRVLVEWLESECACLPETLSDQELDLQVEAILTHARGIARFARLWNDEATRPGAVQLWATQRWGFPLPMGPVQFLDLLQKATSWRPSRPISQAA